LLIDNYLIAKSLRYSHYWMIYRTFLVFLLIFEYYLIEVIINKDAFS